MNVFCHFNNEEHVKQALAMCAVKILIIVDMSLDYLYYVLHETFKLQRYTITHAIAYIQR